MSSVFANRKANRLAIFRKRRGVNDEIDDRLLFVTSPETYLVVDEVDAGAAVDDLVGADDFLKLNANTGAGVWHG